MSTLKLLIQTLQDFVDQKILEMGLPPAQKFVLLMDCYSVHISEEFLQYARDNHPRAILLYIPANYTAFLQPLDITVNYVFKQKLTRLAATWLSEQVQIQLRANGGDVTKIKIDTTLTAIKGPFVGWVAKAIAELKDRKDVVLRGWTESRLAEALTLGRESKEYKDAAALEDEGKSFSSSTGKKRAQLADQALDDQWEDLFADFHAGGQVVDEPDGEADEVESLNHRSVAEVFDMLLRQGRSHVTRSAARQLAAAGM